MYISIKQLSSLKKIAEFDVKNIDPKMIELLSLKGLVNKNKITPLGVEKLREYEKNCNSNMGR